MHVNRLWAFRRSFVADRGLLSIITLGYNNTMRPRSLFNAIQHQYLATEGCLLLSENSNSRAGRPTECNLSHKRPQPPHPTRGRHACHTPEEFRHTPGICVITPSNPSQIDFAPVSRIFSAPRPVSLDHRGSGRDGQPHSKHSDSSPLLLLLCPSTPPQKQLIKMGRVSVPERRAQGMS